MRFNAWHHDKIANNVAGWVIRDTMNCNLPEHGKTQLNHPNPVGLPLGYMAKCKVFDCIQSDLYDLCCFYTLGMTGDPPDFPPLWELVTCSQVKNLMMSARSIGHPYMILAHSTDSITTVSMLWELHTTACLRRLQVDICGKFVKMSFYPFCAYMGTNDLPYLNHIIIAHYNASYGCGKCLKQAFMSSSALHNHKKVCLGFNKKPRTGSNGKPSSSGGGDNSQDSGSTRTTPKKHASKAPAADSQGSSTPTASQIILHCSGCDKSHCCKDSLGDKKKKGHTSPARKVSSHKSHKHSSQH